MSREQNNLQAYTMYLNPNIPEDLEVIHLLQPYRQSGRRVSSKIRELVFAALKDSQISIVKSNNLNSSPLDLPTKDDFDDDFEDNAPFTILNNFTENY
jgi:hypothetical protein